MTGAGARSVRVIPPTVNPITHLSHTAVIKRRVAGYARVSTDSDEQFTSYEAQIDYYTQFIKRHSDWEFVKVYTDEGISATNTKHREGFKEMVTDALSGKIDLIVTKSVSRFARNTVDSLVTIRQLKEKGVECYFEKENIFTFDGKGELLLTIMSSLAQEESRSISENVTWGKRKRFSDGKVTLPYKQFLGYKKGEDGLPQIVPEEAELVRRIYSMFMCGQTTYSIARLLTSESIPTPGGKQKWQSSTIESILTNEKYKGAAVLQKRFTVDFLTKTTKVNEGEVPQYIVENSHAAIIEVTEWEAVQAEVKKRKNIGRQYSGNSIFSSRLICEKCGGFLGPKVWRSNDKYRRVIWQCNNKYKSETHCSTPHLYETDIKERFLMAFNRLFCDKEQLLEDCRLMQTTLTDCTEIDKQLEGLLREIDDISELTRKCISKNSQTAQSQDDYISRYNSYLERYETTKAKYYSLLQNRISRLEKADAIGAFMFEMSERTEPLIDFDDKLWIAIVDRVIVRTDGTFVFLFNNGTEING